MGRPPVCPCLLEADVAERCTEPATSAVFGLTERRQKSPAREAERVGAAEKSRAGLVQLSVRSAPGPGPRGKDQIEAITET